jgi:muconolactone delta-isomerase
MKTLVICRPRPGVTVTDIAAHRAAEMAALRQLKAEGTLAEAYSPGGPGAVLIFDADKEAVEGVVSALPLVLAKLIDTEIMVLQPLPGLAA